MHRLVGGDDRAGDQIGERLRIDGEMRRTDVVAFVRVLVDLAAAVGDDDQECFAALTDGDGPISAVSLV
jgi:hypothetical protein